MSHIDPELLAFAQRLYGTYKEEDYEEEERILQKLADLEAEAEFEAMQEAYDLHQAQQAAEADSHFF